MAFPSCPQRCHQVSTLQNQPVPFTRLLPGLVPHGNSAHGTLTWRMQGAEPEWGEEQSCCSVKACTAGTVVQMHPQFSCYNHDPDPKGTWLMPSCFAGLLPGLPPFPRGSWRKSLPRDKPGASGCYNTLPGAGGEAETLLCRHAACAMLEFITCGEQLCPG